MQSPKFYLFLSAVCARQTDARVTTLLATGTFQEQHQASPVQELVIDPGWSLVAQKQGKFLGAAEGTRAESGKVEEFNVDLHQIDTHFLQRWTQGTTMQRAFELAANLAYPSWNPDK